MWQYVNHCFHVYNNPVHSGTAIFKGKDIVWRDIMTNLGCLSPSRGPLKMCMTDFVTVSQFRHRKLSLLRAS